LHKSGIGIHHSPRDSVIAAEAGIHSQYKRGRKWTRACAETPVIKMRRRIVETDRFVALPFVSIIHS
jgi:hypothetical protein